ncbi:hypothetical protein LINPERHAP1_LOCUS15058 [Linum perenne]
MTAVIPLGRPPDPGVDGLAGCVSPALVVRSSQILIVPLRGSPPMPYKSALSGATPAPEKSPKDWIFIRENNIVSSFKNGIHSIQILKSLKSKMCKP